MRLLTGVLGTLCVAALLSVGLPFLAYAADAVATAVPTASTTVDLGPSVQLVEQGFFAAVTAVLLWLANRAVALIRAHFSAAAADSMRALIETAITNGIAWAQHELDGKLQGKTQVDVRNAIAAAALNYVLPKIPDALDHFGISPASLQQRIVAQVTKLLPPADSSPPSAVAAAPAA